ncbi:MAG: hypothetical protein ACO1Q7_06100 [Gemmatimonas sp.]
MTARAHYRAALEALAGGDTSAALNKLDAAAKSFPPQPSYADALLHLAVRNRNVGYATTALRHANGVGMAIPSAHQLAMAMDADSSFRNNRDLQQERREQQQYRNALNAGTVWRLLKDSSLFAEGVGRDARTGTLYVTSLNHRNVRIVEPNGDERWLMTNVPATMGGPYGVAVDTARGIVWVSSSGAPTLPDSVTAERAALFAIATADGRIVRRIALQTSDRRASPGDLALSRSGDVFVSDAAAGILWSIRAGADTAIPYRHPLFRSLQGIALSDNARVLWVADYSHGLLRVELRGDSVLAVRVADAPKSTTVGLDGLVRHGTTLVGVQNLFSPSQVVRMMLDSTGTRILKQETIDRHDAALSPTGGVMAGNQFVYIGNSWWDRVDANGKLSVNISARATALMRVVVSRE